MLLIGALTDWEVADKVNFDRTWVNLRSSKSITLRNTGNNKTLNVTGFETTSNAFSLNTEHELPFILQHNDSTTLIVNLSGEGAEPGLMFNPNQAPYYKVGEPLTISAEIPSNHSFEEAWLYLLPSGGINETFDRVAGRFLPPATIEWTIHHSSSDNPGLDYYLSFLDQNVLYTHPVQAPDVVFYIPVYIPNQVIVFELPSMKWLMIGAPYRLFDENVENVLVDDLVQADEMNGWYFSLLREFIRIYPLLLKDCSNLD